MRDKNKGVSNSFETNTHAIESETLEPIRKVVRKLKRPDGTTIEVEVPVYPPFRLKERQSRAAASRKENAA